MVTIPSREREALVKERARLINAMKAELTRLGIRSFNPKLRVREQITASDSLLHSIARRFAP